MIKTYFNNLIQLIVILIGVTFVSFSLLYFTPGDPAEIKLLLNGHRPNKEFLEATRIEMGLDLPFFSQYTFWLKNALKGDFGNSYINNEPVSIKIRNAIPQTIKLTTFTVFLSIILSFTFGMALALSKNEIINYFINSIVSVSMAVPSYWLALVLIYVFALKLKIFSAIGGNSFKNLILPSIALAFSSIGILTRQIQSVIVSEMKKDYIFSSMTRGASNTYLIFKEILKALILRVLSIIGLMIGSLLGGTTAIEKIFNIRGLGMTLIEAIQYKDIPVIQCYTIWLSVIYMIITLIIDIMYKKLNHESKKRG